MWQSLIHAFLSAFDSMGVLACVVVGLLQDKQVLKSIQETAAERVARASDNLHLDVLVHDHLTFSREGHHGGYRHQACGQESRVS